MIREINLSLVLNAFRAGIPLSRNDIARVTGLSLPTVSTVIDQLARAGYVVGVDVPTIPGGGRPPAFLALNPGAGAVIAVRITNGKVAIAVIDVLGNELDYSSFKIDLSKSWETTLREVAEACLSLVNDVQPSRVFGVGLAVSGLIVQESGLLRYSTHLPWRNVPIRNTLEKYLPWPIFVENVGQAIAMAEKWFGCGKDAKNLISVNIGAGIGSGIILDGNLYSGSNQNAGEIGHITVQKDGPLCKCGKRGCLAAMVSESQLALRAKAMADAGHATSIYEKAGKSWDEVTLDIMLEAANEGDEVGREIVEFLAEHLGFAIAAVVNLFDPEIIVIVSESPHAETALLRPLEQIVRQYAFSTQAGTVNIQCSPLGKRAGLLGAGTLVLEEVFAAPRLMATQDERGDGVHPYRLQFGNPDRQRLNSAEGCSDENV